MKVQQSRENNVQCSDKGNQIFGSSVANTNAVLGNHHHLQNQPSSGNFNNFCQQQQPPTTFHNNPPAHSQIRQFGPINNNFGNQQGMPQTFLGLRDMSSKNMMSRVSKRDLFLDFEFAHWTDSVFWCKTKNISRIFHSGLVWGWTSPKN